MSFCAFVHRRHHSLVDTDTDTDALDDSDDEHCTGSRPSSDYIIITIRQIVRIWKIDAHRKCS